MAVHPGQAVSGFMNAVNLGQPGQIRVALAGTQPVTGSGTLLTLTFQVVGDVGDTSPLHFLAIQLNEGQVSAQGSDGSVSVVSFPAGDFDHDCRVTVQDINQSALHWNLIADATAYQPLYDLDHDGDVDIRDVLLVAAAWNTTCNQ